jgi:hypothetical protein
MIGCMFASVNILGSTLTSATWLTTWIWRGRFLETGRTGPSVWFTLLLPWSVRPCELGSVLVYGNCRRTYHNLLRISLAVDLVASHFGTIKAYFKIQSINEKPCGIIHFMGVLARF